MSVIPTRNQVPHVTGPLATVQRALASAQVSRAGISGRDVFRIIRKRKWLIILSVLIVAAVFFVGTLLWWSYIPIYKADAFLKVVAPTGSGLETRVSLYGRDIMDRQTRRYAQMVKRDEILQRAADSEELRKTDWFKLDEPAEAVWRLHEEISVSPIANTDLIVISMTGIDREQLAPVVNAVVYAFTGYVAETINQDRQNTINQLKTRLDDLTAERAATVSSIVELQKESAVPGLRYRRSVLDVKLELLTRTLTELEQERSQITSAIEVFKKQDMTKSPEVQQRLDFDPTLRALRNAEMNLETERDNLLRKFGPRHESVKNLETRLASVLAKLTSKEKELAEKYARDLMVGLEGQSEGITAQLVQVRREYNKTLATLRDVDRNLTSLETLIAQRDAQDTDIRKIETVLLELRTQGGAQQRVYVESRASKPREPYMPKWGVMMPLGVVIGALIGFGMTFLLEFMDTSVKSPSDISRRVDLPMLGLVPHTDDLDEEIEDLRVAFMTNPNSLIGEAFRQIRTCLMFSGPASQRKSILVTSALPQDGRSTVTMNLAASCASSGKKTLVVDSNFRQPLVQKLFPDSAQAGLSDALVEQAQWRDLVHEVQPSLWVMSAGTLPPNPAELLGSEKMREMIAEMAAEYDQVIIEGAPCLVVTDSAVLSALVDGVIMVVRAGANTYGVVQRVRDMLTRVGSHIIGVVLNGVRVTAGGYLRKNYETFYQYHEQSQLPHK